MFCGKQLCKIHCSARPQSSVELFLYGERDAVLWIHCHTHGKHICTPFLICCYFNPFSYVYLGSQFWLLLTVTRQQPKDTPYTAVVELFKERHKLFNVKVMTKSKRSFVRGFQKLLHGCWHLESTNNSWWEMYICTEYKHALFSTQVCMRIKERRIQ